MEEVIKKIFKQFCKETKRSGGALLHSSISEWHTFLAEKLEERFLTGSKVDIGLPPRSVKPQHFACTGSIPVTPTF
jgi:hypothetical protein